MLHFFVCNAIKVIKGILDWREHKEFLENLERKVFILMADNKCFLCKTCGNLSQSPCLRR